MVMGKKNSILLEFSFSLHCSVQIYRLQMLGQDFKTNSCTGWSTNVKLSIIGILVVPYPNLMEYLS